MTFVAVLQSPSTCKNNPFIFAMEKNCVLVLFLFSSVWLGGRDCLNWNWVVEPSVIERDELH